MINNEEKVSNKVMCEIANASQIMGNKLYIVNPEVIDTLVIDGIEYNLNDVVLYKKILRIIKEMMEEDTIYDLQRILNKYSNWEDYDDACQYHDENPIIKTQAEFELLRKYCR